MTRTLWTLSLTAALLAPTLVHAGKAHEHGAAKLDIAFEAGKLSIGLETPLDNLLGFERAPRTDAERKAADAAVATLKAGDKLFSIDPAAQCTLGKVELASAPLKLGAAAAAAKADEHGDLDASWEFSCKGSAPTYVEVGLATAFKRMGRIEVQTATAKGQAKVTLKAPARRVALKN